MSLSDQGSMRCFGRVTDGDHTQLATYPASPCDRAATVAVEVLDRAWPPGPRRYCLPCALDYLARVEDDQ